MRKKLLKQTVRIKKKKVYFRYKKELNVLILTIFTIKQSYQMESESQYANFIELSWNESHQQEYLPSINQIDFGPSLNSNKQKIKNSSPTQTQDQIKKMKDQIRKRDLVKVLYKALLHEKIQKKKIKKDGEKVKAYIKKNLGREAKAYCRSKIEILIIFKLILFEEKGQYNFIELQKRIDKKRKLQKLKDEYSAILQQKFQEMLQERLKQVVKVLKLIQINEIEEGINQMCKANEHRGNIIKYKNACKSAIRLTNQYLKETKNI